ncbi:MAG: acetyl-CoA acetyltransferase [Acidobacteria bacterium RIFCSPLOWO2_02_FULL_68_18]|nr:MAG: acetyl-CoA acetyltransferase [Acidobacteria bacterium RIFCSPLOWO2_02_FULL_68_18]OFW49910.1 MAG: acetyl-CoA acetyltransferase [Acidobacteria bacterium RIFCSPLOWO2_12_FULL_68_19]
MQEAVIVSAVRTPTGKFLGGLKSLSASALGALVVREAVARAGIDPASVEECIMGNVVSAGLGQAPARQAALGGGLADHVAALTINKVCGSGLKAVMLAAQGIATGDIEVAVAGGMESMSNAPYLLAGAREGLRMGHRQLLDAMIVDGLWCSFEQCHMGMAGEVVATEYRIGRDQQDEYALRSHCKAATAQAAGRFKAEMLPVVVPARRAGSGQSRAAGPAGSTVVDRDETVRTDATMAALGALEPAFKKDGTVTAGNAPPVNDGAAALVVMSAKRAASLGIMPLARIVGQATSGLPPKYLLMTPVEAVRRLLKKIDWRIEDVDLFELNEAFSAQAVAVVRDLGIDPEKMNINGGAIALGHPLGASGARILTTLLHALAQRNLRRGVATLCLGGGNGVALAVERV